jgi:hypothetical protein
MHSFLALSKQRLPTRLHEDPNGVFEKAAADLLHVNDLKDDAHAMLWRYLALGHMGQDGAAELSANAARLKTNREWPQAVIDFYLGRRSLDEMRTAAGNGNDRCQSEFYAGEWLFLRDNKAEARSHCKLRPTPARGSLWNTMAQFRS